MNEETMRAVVISKPGGPEVLEIRDVPKCPLPTSDRVRVRVHASALNRADILQRKGHYPPPPGFPEDIPGLEFAGEVEHIGPEVRTVKVGQQVFGITGGGAQAEYLIVPESHLALIPDSLSWVEAAAAPEAFITAHDAVFTLGRLQIGERLLIHAVGSGVGLAAAQIASAAGAIVYGTSRTQDKLDRASTFGMDEAILTAEVPEVVSERIKELTHGQGVDVILDLVGAAYLDVNLRSMAKRGRMIQVGTTSGSKAQLDLGIVMSKRLTIIGTVLRARTVEEKATATRLFAKHVVPLLASGKVRTAVDTVSEMYDVRAAHQRMEMNDNFGKIVLMIG